MTPQKRRPRLEVDGWELESAEARHSRWPASFWIPTEEERRSVRPGQAVKLLFRLSHPDAPGTERMWVYVTARVGEWYSGRLQNDPGIEHELRPGSEVWFRAEHIADIDTPPEEFEPQ